MRRKPGDVYSSCYLSAGLSAMLRASEASLWAARLCCRHGCMAGWLPAAARCGRSSGLPLWSCSVPAGLLLQMLPGRPRAKWLCISLAVYFNSDAKVALWSQSLGLMGCTTRWIQHEEAWLLICTASVSACFAGDSFSAEHQVTYCSFLPGFALISNVQKSAGRITPILCATRKAH